MWHPQHRKLAAYINHCRCDGHDQFCLFEARLTTFYDVLTLF